MENIMNFASNKYRRVVRSLFEAETFGLTGECAYAIVMKHNLK